MWPYAFRNKIVHFLIPPPCCCFGWEQAGSVPYQLTKNQL